MESKVRAGTIFPNCDKSNDQIGTPWKSDKSTIQNK